MLKISVCLLNKTQAPHFSPPLLPSFHFFPFFFLIQLQGNNSVSGLAQASAPSICLEPSTLRSECVAPFYNPSMNPGDFI